MYICTLQLPELLDITVLRFIRGFVVNSSSGTRQPGDFPTCQSPPHPALKTVANTDGGPDLLVVNEARTNKT